MNAVIALTDLLLQERSSLNDEQIEHLDVIQTSGHHLLTVSTIRDSLGQKECTNMNNILRLLLLR